jgi:hypothetical protein
MKSRHGRSEFIDRLPPQMKKDRRGNRFPLISLASDQYSYCYCMFTNNSDNVLTINRWQPNIRDPQSNFSGTTDAERRQRPVRSLADPPDGLSIDCPLGFLRWRLPFYFIASTRQFCYR